ncbi:hypothetical protein ABW21_db0202567 [Orbilia brochopaga]|nr:hypothetical protein ABW21_db0202567 [Drechslerella brochopaga]
MSLRNGHGGSCLLRLKRAIWVAKVRVLSSMFSISECSCRSGSQLKYSSADGRERISLKTVSESASSKSGSDPRASSISSWKLLGRQRRRTEFSQIKSFGL